MTFISTASLVNTPRLGILRMQMDMARLSKEVSTGRMADVGLNLGADTARAATLHFDADALAGLIDGNGWLSQRLAQSQTALDKLRAGGDGFLQQLIAARDQATPVDNLALSALSGFVTDANASDGTGHLLAGIDTATAPLAKFDSGPQAAIAAAFMAKFGVSPGDPGASAIDSAGMTDFLDNEFAQLFGDPDWGTTWSSAADVVTRSRISLTETVDTSVSANQPAIRKLAMAYAMVAGLKTDSLSAEVRQTVIDRAISVLGEATSGVTALQQTLGTVERRVTDATQRLSEQRDIIATRIGTLEGVDPAEAKTRIDMLSTQVEMSYSLTAKLLQMSILNFA